MSAGIFYRVVEPKEDRIYVGAPSSFIESMNRAFGSYPWRLSCVHVEVLRGMAAASCDGAARNPYEAIIDLITHANGLTRTIEVWPEY